MAIDGLQMNGPAAAAFGLLLLAAAVSLAGDAVERVLMARRRWGQRERELAALEAFHGLVVRRPTDTNRKRHWPLSRHCH